MEKDKDRFPLLKRILKAIGLSGEAVDDIIERILDWLSTKDDPIAESTSLPFKLRADFLSNAELSFFRVLQTVVDNQLLICPKVNLGDLFFAATDDNRKNRSLANRIDRKHVDFLLCDRHTAYPMLGIELDDKSHARPDRKTRDNLVDSVFAAASLPLLRIPVKTAYAPADLVTLINEHLGSVAPTTTAPNSPQAEANASGENANPNCPKCGSKMVLRTAQKGPKRGSTFWGCSNFPRCRG